jgi:hypothetical protein
MVFNKYVYSCSSLSFIWTHFLIKFINPVYTYLKLLSMQIFGKWYVTSVLDSVPQKCTNVTACVKKVFNNCKNAVLCCYCYYYYVTSDFHPGDIDLHLRVVLDSGVHPPLSSSSRSRVVDRFYQQSSSALPVKFKTYAQSVGTFHSLLFLH